MLVIEELQQSWEARNSESNKLPHFPASIVGSIDSVPIYVLRPRKKNWQRHLYNGKYKAHVVKVRTYFFKSQKIFILIFIFCLKLIVDLNFLFLLKIQAVCDHSGTIIWYSGPHLGTPSDIALFEENRPPLSPNEQLLADKAYVKDQWTATLYCANKKSTTM
jgi:hypothetical protein